MVENNAPCIVFTMTHPHDVHLFRNAIDELSSEGYRIYVFAREKDITTTLLENYGIPHTVLASDNTSKLDLIRSWSTFGFNLLRAVRRIEPDLMVAEVGAVTTPVSRLLGIDSLVFVDNEHAKLQRIPVSLCATRICTSTSFWDDLGAKQVKYKGYQELAYLHPNRFQPDPTVLDEVGIESDERFAILRAVGWNAAHDINAGGFDKLETVIEALESEGVTVLVSSELPLPEELESYRVSVAPQRMHDLMYYADLFIGESATMATESALLGTPAVYVSTLDVGYTHEIADEYGLIFNYSGKNRQERAIQKAKAILNGSCETDWNARWRLLIDEKRDTTEVIMEQIHNMTESPVQRKEVTP